MSAESSPVWGQRHEIRHGDYRAGVSEVGGGLQTLTHAGANLVAPYRPDQLRPVYRGAVLAPWPNRVEDGRYRWLGREHQLALTEAPRRTALHGLVAWVPWALTGRSADSVRLSHRLWPQDGYPFLLDLAVTYTLDDDGLLWRLEAHNRGGDPAPYGCSVHPYLVAGAGRVDDWTFELGAASYLEVEPERLLPTGLRSVDGSSFDFRGGRPLRDLEIDHAFTDVARGASGPGSAGSGRLAQLSGRDGSGVQMEWSAECAWVQVHTADRPEPELNRAGLAVEPMTCPPNAFRTGTGVVTLEPGERFEAWWRIGAR